MRVVLARPYDGHEPNETVDLPDAEARRLLADGKARNPDGSPPPPTGPPVVPSASGYRGPVPPSDPAYAGPTTDAPDAGEGDAS